ncbi:MAG TPA: PA14 domain-containing protein [Solirubrobacteraceae bacterium]|nr:PA14 domain-containing protein [Solirubrobacteraceae bacterium]
MRALLVLLVAGPAAVASGAAVGAAPDPRVSPPPAGLSPLEPGQPAAEQLAHAAREAGRRAERQRLERQLPAAKAEREASRRAHRGLGRDAALALAAERFEGSATASALRPFAGADDVHVLNRFTARVMRDGRASVLVSDGPLAADADGEPVPLDLRLERRGDRFVPAAAPAAVAIPARLRDGLRAPDGVTIEHHAGDDVSGERVRGAVVYPSAETDVDVVIRPTVEGAELYDVLRSPESPEELAISVDAPGGASLRTGRDRDAGFDVVRDGRVLGRFGTPFAIDADGVPVDVETEAEGSTLRMVVRHRGRDLRYPILVDPPYAVSESFDWNCSTPPCSPDAQWNGRAGWYFEANAPTSRFWWGVKPPGSWLGGGLGIEHQSGGTWFEDSEYAYWRYRSVGQTRIVSASLTSSLAAASGSSLCLFRGISGWSKEGNFVWEVSEGANTMCGDGQPETCCGDEWLDRSAAWSVKGRLWNNLLSGIYFRFGGNRSFFVHRTKQAFVELWDDEDPSIAADVPSGWTRQTAFTARASDPGTGVREVRFNGQSQTSACTGTRQALCPDQASVTATLPDGVNAIDAIAFDGTGRAQRHGGGLRAEYYDDHFTGHRVDKTDSRIDFAWGDRSPDPALHEDSFSGRWTGRIRPAVSGTYSFHLQSDDDSEVWLDGRLLTRASCCTEGAPGTVTLEAGRFYNLEVDYREYTADAYLRLLWSGPGIAKQLVPREVLFPPAPAALPPFEVKVDSSSPSVTPSGELWDRRGQTIDRSASASVRAEDGDPLGGPAARRSGVQRIEAWLTYPTGLRVLQSKVDQGTSCTVKNAQGQDVQSPDSCPLTHSYTFDGGNPAYPAGQYEIEFLAYDHVGNPAGRRAWTFTKGDLTDPLLLALSHEPPLPAGWVDDHRGRVTGTATDVGTGLHRLELTEPLSGGDQARPKRYKSPGTQTDCEGTLQLPCPAAGDQSFDYGTAAYREGHVSPSVVAVDASGRRSSRSAYTLKVDHTGPAIAFEGPLAPYRNGAVVTAGQHRLDVRVTDGVRGGTPAEQRSGVKSTELQVSRDEGPFESRGVVQNDDCLGDSCPDDATYTVDTAAFGDGLHAIRVIAYDRLDHRSEVTFRFFVDLEPPALESVTHDPPLPAWVGSQALGVSATASDRGTGVQRFVLTRRTPSGDADQVERLACELSPEEGRRCPKRATVRIAYSGADLAEGVGVPLRLRAIDAVGRESGANEWTVDVDHSAPSFDADFSIGAYFDSASGAAVVDWDPADDPLLADGSDGSGVSTYHYRVQRDGGPWSAWQATGENTAALASSRLGEPVRVEVRAEDAAGNSSGVVSAATVVGSACEPSADGYVPDCTDDAYEGMDDPENAAVLTPEAYLAVGTGTSAAPAPAIRYKVNVAGGSWVTIRSRQQSYVLGLAHDGWYMNVTGSRNVGSANYKVGLVLGDYQHCGWINAAYLDPTEQREESNCTTSFAPRDQNFAVGVNCSGCGGGTRVRLRAATPECAVVHPTPAEGRPDRCQRKIRSITSEQVARGYEVEWRYVTRGRKYVLVKDRHFNNPDGSWVFVHRSALPRRLCRRAGGCDPDDTPS